jgi:hypothetical protein
LKGFKGREATKIKEKYGAEGGICPESLILLAFRPFTAIHLSH